MASEDTTDSSCPPSVHTSAMIRVIVVLLALMAAASVLRGISIALSPRGSVDLGLFLKSSLMLFHTDPYAGVSELPPLPAPTRYTEHNPWPSHPLPVPSVLLLLWPYAWLSWPVAK